VYRCENGRWAAKATKAQVTELMLWLLPPRFRIDTQRQFAGRAMVVHRTGECGGNPGEVTYLQAEVVGADGLVVTRRTGNGDVVAIPAPERLGTFRLRVRCIGLWERPLNPLGSTEFTVEPNPTGQRLECDLTGQFKASYGQGGIPTAPRPTDVGLSVAGTNCVGSEPFVRFEFSSSGTVNFGEDLLNSAPGTVIASLSGTVSWRTAGPGWVIPVGTPARADLVADASPDGATLRLTMLPGASTAMPLTGGVFEAQMADASFDSITFLLLTMSRRAAIAN
jgi:hypothetical protein